MDRSRPIYTRQRSGAGTPGAPNSPTLSPMHHHTRSGSVGLSNPKKAQNAKAAAQRLQHVMSHQVGSDDEEDDLLLDYGPSSGIGSIGLAGGRATRSRSPMTVRPTQEQPQSAKPASVGRPSISTSHVDQPLSTIRSSQSIDSIGQPPKVNPIRASRSSQSISSIDQPLSPYNALSSRISQSASSNDQPSSARLRPSQSNNSLDQPLSARSSISARKSSQTIEQQPPSARSYQVPRPHLGVKTVPMVPATVPISLKPTTSTVQQEAQNEVKKDKRLSLTLGSMNYRESTPQRSSSVLEDELDMLQEENEGLVEKLRLAEEKSEEAEARARQLERQIANLGEGVTMEARLLSRKQAALQQREAALRSAAKTHGGGGAFRIEAETTRDGATSTFEHLQETEHELRSLKVMTQRMILSKDEMEEVALKRCWLARYWGLCVQHGIHPAIAKARYEYWASFAPEPVEVVLAAGLKAKEEDIIDDIEERENALQDMDELLSGEGNVENMVMVEKGLRELASLKVEEAVALVMTQQRRQTTKYEEEVNVPTEGQFEAYELSEEEVEDVIFKQAWLAYFWRKAKNYGVEPDIADERLQFWINQNTETPNSHDAVDVERGLSELKKLGIETQLWEEARRELELEFHQRIPNQSAF